MRVPPFKETPIDIPYPGPWNYGNRQAVRTLLQMDGRLEDDKLFVSFWGRWDGLSSPGGNWTVSFRECRCLKRIIKITQMVNHEQPPGCFLQHWFCINQLTKKKNGEKSSTTESPSCFASTKYVFFWWLRRTFRKNIFHRDHHPSSQVGSDLQRKSTSRSPCQFAWQNSNSQGGVFWDVSLTAI